jgi:single-stranded-DNA-specific exonuclease
VKRLIRRRACEHADSLPASLPPLLRRLYAARGVRTADDLALELRALLPVGSLDGIESAVQRLCAELARGGRIVVVGDFDADGATSTALVVRQLRRLGFPDVGFRVPDRMRHGYGLSPLLVEEIATERPALLITVDNGVAAHAGVDAARAHGIDVLVTDHHLPGATLPACVAMVNPNVAGARFGSRALAGVGVAFYLMAALTRRLEAERGTKQPPVADFLDLVAVGTVADLVPLDRNNRILVDAGLKRLRAGRAVAGLVALARASSRPLADLGARDLGFSLGPRINAAGRIDDMGIGIRCLLTDDVDEATTLAATLERLNVERRELESRMREEALDAVRQLRIDEGRLPAGLTLFDAGWHPGVVGLVASRVKDRVHRPVAAFAPAADESLRGSVRSVAGVHIRDVLEAIDVRHPGLIERFGGHAMAAGLSLPRAHVDRFERAFAEEVSRWLSPADMQGIIDSDGALEPHELTLEVATALERAGPWGQAFPEPLFDGEFDVVDARTVGGAHLKLWLRPAQAAPPVESIAFGHFTEARAPGVARGDRVRVAYRLGRTDFGGTPRPELRVEYLEPVAR